MMLETMTSPKIKPYNILTLSSSLAGCEDNRMFTPITPILKRSIDSAENNLSHLFNTVTYTNDLPINFRNETFRNKEAFSEEMLEYDIFVKMPPKKEYIVNARIVHRCKAEPHIIVPDNPYTE